MRKLQKYFVWAFLISVTLPIYPAIVYGNRGLKPSLFFALLISIVSLARAVNGHGLRINKISRACIILWVCASASLGSVLLTGPTADRVIDFLTIYTQLTVYVSLIFSLTTLRLSASEMAGTIKLYITCTTLIGLFALYQTVARMYGLPFDYLEIVNPSLAPREGAVTRGGEFGAFIRPSAFFTEPSRLGQFLLTPFYLVSYFVLKSTNLKNTTYSLLLLLIIGTSLLVSFSIGAYISLGSAIFIGFLIKKTRSVVTYMGSMLVLLILLASVFLYPFINTSFFGIVYTRVIAHLREIGLPLTDLNSPYAITSVPQRLDSMRKGLDIWLEHPLFGVGLNNSSYFVDVSFNSTGIHSAFIQSLAEMGAIGGVAFTYFVVALLASAYKISPFKIPSRELDYTNALRIALLLSLISKSVWLFITGTYIIDFLWVDIALLVLLANTEEDFVR